jgi:MtN3 and saliva related transmembrane protein
MMDPATLVGFGAGFLSTVAFVPQVHKIWKTRSARDVSLHTFAAFTAGVALWLAYGILKQELPIIVWNAVTLALAGAILAMKLKFG